MVLQRAKGAVCGSASLGQREYNLAICKLARVNLFSQVVWLVRRFAFINIHFFFCRVEGELQTRCIIWPSLMHRGGRLRIVRQHYAVLRLASSHSHSPFLSFSIRPGTSLLQLLMRYNIPSCPPFSIHTFAYASFVCIRASCTLVWVRLCVYFVRIIYEYMCVLAE